MKTNISISEDFPLVGCYSFYLDVEGWKLKVTYKYHSFKDILDEAFYHESKDTSYHHVHFEFRGRTASSTGYKSYFTYVENLSSCPYMAATLFAKQLFEEVKKQCPERLVKEVQLSLF